MFAARPASAQALPLVGSPTGLYVGGFFPSGDAQKRGGSSQLAAELRYAFPVSVPLTPTRTVISLGAEFGSKHGNHNTIVPVTIAEYVGLNGHSPYSALTPYAGAGVGAYFLNQSGISTKTQIGGFGALGYNLALGFFIEAKYQFVQHGNGALVGVGFRF